MRIFGHLSFKWKLTLIIMIACVFSILAACAAFIWYDNYTFKQQMTADLESLSRTISAVSRTAVNNQDKAAVAEALLSLRARDQIVVAAIYSKDGTVLGKYVKEPGRESIPADPSKMLNRFDGDFLAMFRAISGEGGRIGTLYLKADLTDKLQGRVRRYIDIHR